MSFEMLSSNAAEATDSLLPAPTVRWSFCFSLCLMAAALAGMERRVIESRTGIGREGEEKNKGGDGIDKRKKTGERKGNKEERRGKQREGKFYLIKALNRINENTRSLSNSHINEQDMFEEAHNCLHINSNGGYGVLCFAYPYSRAHINLHPLQLVCCGCCLSLLLKAQITPPV